MEYLTKLDTFRTEIEELERLKTRKERLEYQLQEISRQTFDVNMDGDVDEAVDLHEYHSLVNILETYRLLGVSLLQEKTGLTLRFDTLYQNQYPAVDFHCIQLVKKGDNYAVGKHNLPPFIPVSQIEEKYLAHSLGRFVGEIRNYLYAYVQRREGIRRVKDEYSNSLVQKVDVNLPVTFVCLTLDMENNRPCMEVKLHFDLLKCKPDSVDVKFVEDVDRSANTPDGRKRQMDKLLSKWKASLTDVDVYSALTKLLAKG